MRVISGTARGRKQEPAGMDIRPTSDRIKIDFNIISSTSKAGASSTCLPTGQLGIGRSAEGRPPSSWTNARGKVVREPKARGLTARRARRAHPAQSASGAGNSTPSSSPAVQPG